MHKLPEPQDGAVPEWADFEDLRAERTLDEQRASDAYGRMSEAETILYKRWEQQNGSDELNGDLVGLLLSLPVAPDGRDELLYILGLGEKVAALGGRLEVSAVFGEETVKLISEPGPDGQPPIIEPGSLIANAKRIPTTTEPTRSPDGRVRVGLTEDERGLLTAALEELGHEARLPEGLAREIGYANLDDLQAESERLRGMVHEARPLSPAAWRRVLITAEIVFASDVYGVGRDWETYTGLDDTSSISILRAVQTKLDQLAHEV